MPYSPCPGMKQTLLYVAFLLLGAPAAGIASPAPPSALTDPATQPAANIILVEGDGFTVSRAQLEEEQRVHQDEVQEMQADGLPPQRIAWLGLQSLINKYVVLARATAADRHESTVNFGTNLREHKAKLKISDAAFEQALARQLAGWGMSRQRWQERGIEHCLGEVVTRRELGTGITDEAVVKYYQDRLINFDVPEKIRAKYLLLCTVDRTSGLRLTPEQMTAKRTELETILRRVRAGEDLAVLARQFSEAGPAKDQSGLYAFSRGQSTAEFEQAAFALKPGEISAIITTDTGDQIVQVIEKIPGRRLGLDEVRPQIRNSIMFEQSDRYLQRLKTEAGIRILDPELKAEAAKPAPASPPAVRR